MYLVHSQSVDNSLMVFQNLVLLTQSTQEFLCETTGGYHIDFVETREKT